MIIDKDPYLKILADQFFAALIVGFAAASIKVSIQLKKEKMSVFRIFLSYVIGISCSYIAYLLMYTVKSGDLRMLVIAVVAISGEKIGEYFIYKFKVDAILGAIIEAIKKAIIRMIEK